MVILSVFETGTCMTDKKYHLIHVIGYVLSYYSTIHLKIVKTKNFLNCTTIRYINITILLFDYMLGRTANGCTLTEFKAIKAYVSILFDINGIDSSISGDNVTIDKQDVVVDDHVTFWKYCCFETVIVFADCLLFVVFVLLDCVHIL